MKLKSEKHKNASLDKSLRAPVYLVLFRKKKNHLRQDHGCSESSFLLFLAPLSSRYLIRHNLLLTISSYDRSTYLLLIIICTSLFHQDTVQQSIKCQVGHSCTNSFEQGTYAVGLNCPQNAEIIVGVPNRSIDLEQFSISVYFYLIVMKGQKNISDNPIKPKRIPTFYHYEYLFSYKFKYFPPILIAAS